MSEPMETVDPIKRFWGDVEFSLNESAFKYILDDLRMYATLMAWTL